MKTSLTSSRQQVLFVVVTLLALGLGAAEYRPRPGPPGTPPGPPPPRMRGPPNKGYLSPAKHHHDHHFQQNSYSGPGPSFPKGSQLNRPMRYRKPGPPPQMGRPSWENSSFKLSGLDRYKSPGHYSSGEPPAGLSSSSGYQGFSGFESSSSGMSHLNDLSPIRTIPAPNLGPSSWPAATHLGMTRLTSQMASQSPAVFPTQLHPSLDFTDASALLASSNQHGYQVSEAPPSFAADAQPSLLRTGLDAKLENDLSLRLSPYTSMSQLMNQRFSPLSSLSNQDLFHLLNGFPLQQNTHTYLQPAQTSATEAALQSQLQQAQLQQAQLQQLQQAQLQQAQLQQAQLQQAQLQQAQLDSQAGVGSTPSSLRFSFDDQTEQLLQASAGRRGHLPQELDSADSSPVVRLYGSSHQTRHEDPEVDGSEPSGISVSPSSGTPHDADDEEYDEHRDQQSSNMDAPQGSGEDMSDAITDHEDERPTRIRTRTRKNRDRLPSS